MDVRHVAAGLLLVTVALAGCAQEEASISAAEAKDLCKSSFADTEAFKDIDAVGIESTAEANGSEVFSYQIQVDPDDRAFLVQMSMDESLAGSEQVSPQLLENLAFGQKGKLMVFPDLQGNLSLRRDHVPEFDEFDDFGDVNSVVGDETTDQNLGPDFGMLGLNGHCEDFTVEEVTSTTVNGKAAWNLRFTFENASYAASGDLAIYKESELPARGSWTVETKAGTGSEHPLFRLSEASMSVEFRYDDEVEVTLPDAQRAPVTIDKSQSSDGQGNISGSISASHDQEVPLGEIELRITSEVNGSQSPFGPSPDPDKVHYTMVADQGTKENASYALSYDDADGDGYLSANDTFSATIKDEDRQGDVELHFYDTWAAKYEYQPGFEAFGALAAAGAAVWIVRRRD